MTLVHNDSVCRSGRYERKAIRHLGSTGVIVEGDIREEVSEDSTQQRHMPRMSQLAQLRRLDGWPNGDHTAIGRGKGEKRSVEMVSKPLGGRRQLMARRNLPNEPRKPAGCHLVSNGVA
jgi:hypothetical protein